MATKRQRPVDIYLLGRGIVDGTRQMTLEATKALQSARLVFDLSGDAGAVRALNANVVDLYTDYWTGELCDDVYGRLEKTVVDEVRRNGPTVAVIVDGHPMVFDDVNWSLLRKGKRRQLNVVALPGVSCIDTMMIDVGVDLGEGAQIVSANQIVLYGISLDAKLQTYVLQVGKFGTGFYSRETKKNRPGRFTPLAEYLTRFYPADHLATLIVSRGKETVRRRVRLGELDSARTFLHLYQDEGLTMHIPARDSESRNEQFARDVDDLDHLATIAVLA
jgi:uncharacterized protein YabN with tetrapyrrole methylase and pyrophosphatase domain